MGGTYALRNWFVDKYKRRTNLKRKKGDFSDSVRTSNYVYQVLRKLTGICRSRWFDGCPWKVNWLKFFNEDALIVDWVRKLKFDNIPFSKAAALMVKATQ